MRKGKGFLELHLLKGTEIPCFFNLSRNMLKPKSPSIPKLGALLKNPKFLKTLIFGFLISLCFSLGTYLRIARTNVDRQLAPYSDETYYHYGALNLIKFKTLADDRDGEKLRGVVTPEPTALGMPGYTIYVAIIYSVFGVSTSAVFISQVFLSVINMLMCYLMAKELSLNRIGIISAVLLTAIYPGFYLNLDLMLTEQLSSTLFMTFFYFLLKSLHQKYKLVYLGTSSLFLGFSILIRAIFFPFIFVALFFIIVYNNDNFRYTVRRVVVFVAPILFMLSVWWIRNYVQFGEFYLLTPSGDGVKLWGFSPYLLNVSEYDSSPGVNVLMENFNANPTVFLKWRLFGFIQYMWGSVWTEILSVSKLQGLNVLLLLQTILIVPCLVAIPIFIKRTNREFILISSTPILFTLMLMDYQALPRYIWPSLPFIFIVFGAIVSVIMDRGGNITVIPIIEYRWQKFLDFLLVKGYLVFCILFSGILVYSVYAFSLNINEEESTFRLSKYMNIDLNDLRGMETSYEVTLKPKDMASNNLIETDVGDSINYKTLYDAPGILSNINKIQSVNINGRVVTRVDIYSKGGFFSDYMVIFWHDDEIQKFDPLHHYRFPVNPFQTKQTVYIDHDVENLDIVPRVMRSGSFTLDKIVINKYVIK